MSKRQVERCHARNGTFILARIQDPPAEGEPVPKPQWITNEDGTETSEHQADAHSFTSVPVFDLSKVYAYSALHKPCLKKD